MTHGDERRPTDGDVGGSGDDRYAQLAAKLLAEQQQECPRQDVHRDAVIAAMALVVAGRRRRRWVVGGASALVAAAAVVLLVRSPAGNESAANPARAASPAPESTLVVEHETGHGNLLVRAAKTSPLPDLGVLAAGDSVRSGPDSSATLAFPNGTRLTLSPNGQLRIDDLGATRRFSLLGGQLQAHVAKLGRGERFIVTTPDSEVEVRGTVFSVAVEGPTPSCPTSSSTSTVFVSEGGVWVRSRAKETVLVPGETWITPCQELRAPAQAVAQAGQAGVGMGGVGSPLAADPSARVNKGSARPPAAKASAVRAVKQTSPSEVSKFAPVAAAPAPALSSLTSAPSPVSSLAEQNDLFSDAMAAERAGLHDLALIKLDDLLTRFATGPLSESARAQRERILSAQNSR